jgi:threonine dehydratase
MKQVVEPTGVLGLAAAFKGKIDVKGQKVGVILSGGNADVPEMTRRMEQLTGE